MKKVLLSCLALAAGATMAMAQDNPVFPSELNFTLNGETELTGVKVSQTMETTSGTDYLTITITGEYDADTITFDFETPDGWDYALVNKPISGDSPFTTRSSDPWVSISAITSMGYKQGNSFKFSVNGSENYGSIFLAKGDNAWEDPIDVIFKVSKAGGTVEPTGDLEYPEKLALALNGEPRLPDVNVTQTMENGQLSINITGQCDGETLEVTFGTPEGWDSLMISDTFGYGSISTVETRSELSMIPVSSLEGMGFKEGNTFTVVADGYDNPGEIALIKGDEACATFIKFNIAVKDGGSGPVVGDDTLIPESVGITTYAEGLIVDQERDPEYGTINVDVTGAISEMEYDLVLDIPEGWDGYVIYPFTQNITVGEQNVGPRKISAIDHNWVPIEEVFEEGYVMGNKLTIKVTGGWEFADAYLYKGEMVDLSANVVITSSVTNKTMEEVPFPESFSITFNGKTSLDLIEATQGYEQDVYTINVSGMSLEDEVTVALAVPEEWDAIISWNDDDNDPNIEPLSTRARESEWAPVEELLAGGFNDSNALTFPVDGEEHYGQFYLVKNGMVDVANQIVVEFNVSNPTTGVAGVEAIDGNARYYDLSGRKIAKPAAGMYIKVLDGKASKVIVK